MSLDKLEKNIGKMVSNVRKDYTDRGPENMKVSIEGNSIRISFDVDSVDSELFLVGIIVELGAHRILLDKMGSVLVELFTPHFKDLHPSLEIESLNFFFPKKSMRHQDIHILLNFDLECLYSENKLNIGTS